MPIGKKKQPLIIFWICGQWFLEREMFLEVFSSEGLSQSPLGENPPLWAFFSWFLERDMLLVGLSQMPVWIKKTTLVTKNLFLDLWEMIPCTNNLSGGIISIACENVIEFQLHWFFWRIICLEQNWLPDGLILISCRF